MKVVASAEYAFLGWAMSVELLDNGERPWRSNLTGSTCNGGTSPAWMKIWQG